MNRTETMYDFAEMLRSHDWFYVMSDDQRVYNNGRYNAERIQEYIDNCPHEDLRPLLEQMYKVANADNQITTI